jgi:hypothetical protein
MVMAKVSTLLLMYIEQVTFKPIQSQLSFSSHPLATHHHSISKLHNE